MNIEQIFSFVLTGICILFLFFAMISAMETCGKKTFKMVCTQIVAFLFSVVILVLLGNVILSSANYAVWEYFSALAVVSLVSFIFYKTGRANTTTDSIWIFTIILGILLFMYSLPLNMNAKEATENSKVIVEKTEMSESDVVLSEIPVKDDSTENVTEDFLFESEDFE